jgi:hypothetical protein
MTLGQIIEIITPYIEASLTGGTQENPKFDFKKEWYNLNDLDGIAEFLIDTSSIANTLGKDGFIIVGYDDKGKSFFQSPFKQCGLRDNSDIMKLVSKHVESIYTIHTFEIDYNNNIISVIHIPPSNGMPHVIKHYHKTGKDYEQMIFTRKNTGKFKVNKYDLELMFYYRQYLIPEYLVETSFHIENLRLTTSILQSGGREYIRFHYTASMDFENLGRRPVSIVDVNFDLTQFENARNHHKLSINFAPGRSPIVVQPGQIISRELKQEFDILPENNTGLSNLMDRINANKYNLVTKSVSLTFSNGQKYESMLRIGGLFNS